MVKRERDTRTPDEILADRRGGRGQSIRERLEAARKALRDRRHRPSRR